MIEQPNSSESESVTPPVTPTPAKRSRWGRRIMFAVVFLFLGLQLVPAKRTNPPVTGDLIAPAEVKAILKESCYDCHSNETYWPWYSYVNPMGLIVSHHVEEGREYLNFSEWENWDEDEQELQKENIWSFCNKEEEPDPIMPPPDYVLMHPKAELTPEEFKILDCWIYPDYCEQEAEEEELEEMAENASAESVEPVETTDEESAEPAPVVE